MAGRDSAGQAMNKMATWRLFMSALAGGNPVVGDTAKAKAFAQPTTVEKSKKCKHVAILSLFHLNSPNQADASCMAYLIAAGTEGNEGRARRPSRDCRRDLQGQGVPMPMSEVEPVQPQSR